MSGVAEDRTFAESIEVDGARLFAKGGPLAPRAARRHALRQRVLRAALPRVREYENLRWLRERVFQAPQPFAAAVLWSRGLPRFQVLVLEEVRDASTLDLALSDASLPERAALAQELGGEVGRMHALRFVHRDLFARNLLVVPREAHRRLVFIDAWRARPGRSLRGPAYDLACLFLEGAELWSEDEQRLLLDAYAASRAAQGSEVESDLMRRITREREGLLARLRRAPARLGGRAMPGPWRLDWSR
ncbi:MAG: hypothetical protein O2816_14215 [Planctomycetota bacterium]|nr:hypothetical protein [Planctomycetota bacterium]